MSAIIHLQTFTQVVPVCLDTTTVETLQSIFHQGECDRIVVVNRNHHPIGVVQLRRWLPYFLNPSKPERVKAGRTLAKTNRKHKAGNPAPPFPLEPLLEASRQKSTPQHASAPTVLFDHKQTLREVGYPWVEPLVILPAELSIEEFWHYLGRTASTEDCPPLQPSNLNPPSGSTLALVNSQGQFIGLLDILNLLRFVALNPEQASQTASFHQPLVPQYPHPTSEDISPTHPAPALTKLSATLELSNLLLEFLEELPMPLMVQTQTGEIVCQNAAWRSLIGTSPMIVREVAESVTRWSPQNCNGNPSWQETVVGANTWDGSMGSVMPSWCERSHQGDTYVCICPIPNSSERVWQFVRHQLQGNWRETQPASSSGMMPEPSVCPMGLWLVLAQDITEQHRVAQELAAKNADLVQLNRLKDEFLACISHELKTPLTAVLGLSSLLKDQALGELNERQARYARLIHQSGRHLMMVVNDILDLTRMETGQLELMPEPVDIHAVCDRAWQLALQQVLQEHNKRDRGASTATATSTNTAEIIPKFTLEVEPTLDSFVADELRLRQMLVHLLSNALKFTPNSGEMGLYVSRWENWIAFTVWDTGIGIPEDKQHLIFQKFQQLENPLTRKFEGTGLGLVLTQRLARLHGGDVSFISKQDKGSQFTLLLPPSPPQKDWSVGQSSLESAQKAAKLADFALQQSRVALIVEAVPRFIQDFTEQLSSLGYRVVIARSGTEALEKARRLQPKMIFLNPVLPLLSGWDVLTLLKTDEQTHQIPVIVTATSGDKQRASVHQSDGFLNLPIQKSELQEILAKLTKKSFSNSEQQLTILWLNPSAEPRKTSAYINSSVAFSGSGLGGTEPAIHTVSLVLQQSSKCRILEADDLNQAQLLARIWNPNVMVLESVMGIVNPTEFLQNLSQQESLMDLPIVTLDSHTTQIANQIENLSIFPCLVQTPCEEVETVVSSETIASALLMVIQIAAMGSWKPCVLVIDSEILPTRNQPIPCHPESRKAIKICNYSSPNSSSCLPSEGLPVNTATKTPSYGTCDPTAKIDQALVQYLERAGFRAILGRCWVEALQQIQCQSVDVLIIGLRESSLSALVHAFSTLDEMQVQLPIIILDQSNLKVGVPPQPETDIGNLPMLDSVSRAVSPVQWESLRPVLSKPNVKLFSCKISMAELLQQIQTLLHLGRQEAG